jgi:hypothetical protein
LSLGLLRGIVIAICAGGIAGMIIGTVATDNNNGVVITFGIITAVAMLTLITSTMAVKASQRPADGELDDVLAEGVEARITTLVAAGVDEGALRDLVGDAVRLGRSAR